MLQGKPRDERAAAEEEAERKRADNAQVRCQGLVWREEEAKHNI